MILKQSAVGEYDRRIVILTKERGKITAFARGARRPGKKMAACSNPFSFGTFKLIIGREAYTLADAEITNYFEDLRMDFEGAYYGMYFAEIADYYTRENNDEILMLKLLYQSLRALTKESLNKRLVRSIYEIKAIMVNGEFPGILTDRALSESAVYAIEYIQNSSIEKLYTFTVSDSVLAELVDAAELYRRRVMKYDFKSLEILQTLY